MRIFTTVSLCCSFRLNCVAIYGVLIACCPVANKGQNSLLRPLSIVTFAGSLFTSIKDVFNALIDAICEHWNLKSANDCLPHILRPDGEVDTWPPDLVHRLAQLACTTRNKRTSAVRELLQVWQLRLRRYPESNPDLCASDVEFVNKRRGLENAARRNKWTQEEREANIPRLDAFPSPSKWKKRQRVDLADNVESPEARRKRKGKGPVHSQTPLPMSRSELVRMRRLVTAGSSMATNADNWQASDYVELASEITLIPENLSPAQRMKIFRLRDALRVKDLEYIEICIKQKLKQRNLAHMRYEVGIYEALLSRASRLEKRSPPAT
ncbi:hypothetical protein DE146DRAFT_773238 [Phaeosphaeria sp. MPI-PUGE-AT-0046c]|nr:hypothetical protein DE146DRAFT_773238 [Phaeosphaeria sp. MPI-PUGE-AT-0046c]